MPREKTMRIDVNNNQGLDQVPVYYQVEGRNELTLVTHTILIFIGTKKDEQ